ncbi:MAG: hypothetical protein DRI01_07255 [Chloroflexi bacterium]|nr:MAG: hypothetical protein DRI01_07255 [Chloroflexota bacterium]
MAMWKSKSCPRCGGDIFIDRDLEDWYEQYLQCGYRSEVKNLDEFKERSAQRDKEPTEVRG